MNPAVGLQRVIIQQQGGSSARTSSSSSAMLRPQASSSRHHRAFAVCSRTHHRPLAAGPRADAAHVIRGRPGVTIPPFESALPHKMRATAGPSQCHVMQSSTHHNRRGTTTTTTVSSQTTAKPPGRCSATLQQTMDACSPYTGWILVAIGWGMLAAYHIFLFFAPSAKNHLLGTLTGPDIESRKRWATYFTKSKKDTITAVQSLRNGLMVAVSNASLSLALLSVCLGPLLDAWGRGSFPLQPELLPFAAPVLLFIAKFGVLFGLLIAMFVCFSQVCYYWVHLTFVIPVTQPDSDSLVDVEGVIDIAIHAQGFWWWGYRCLYMLIPAVIWVVLGTVPFLCTACIMVALLAYLDRPLRKARPLEYYL